jgi:hypothetical protein
VSLILQHQLWIDVFLQAGIDVEVCNVEDPTQKKTKPAKSKTEAKAQIQADNKPLCEVKPLPHKAKSASTSASVQVKGSNVDHEEVDVVMESSQAESDMDYSQLDCRVEVKMEATRSVGEQAGVEAAENAKTPLRRSSRPRKQKPLSKSFLELTEILAEEDRERAALIRTVQHAQASEDVHPAGGVDTDVKAEEPSTPGTGRSLSRGHSSGVEVEMLLTGQSPRKKQRIEE